MTTKTEIRRFGAQENTANDPMGKMAGPAGVIRYRLMNLAFMKSGSHLRVTIQTSLAPSLLRLFINARNQGANQKKQEYKLTCFS